MAVVSTRAILLRSFPYGETSRILRFLTLELGLVGVVAKGVRTQGSKRGGGLETFSEGTLTLYHKESRGLQTFKDFAPLRSRRALGTDVLRFAGAGLLGELVLKHAGEEANPPLYQALGTALDRLEDAGPQELAWMCLSVAWGLVAVLGYRPVLEHCVACGRALGQAEMGRFDFAAGGLRCGTCGGSEGAGPRVGPGARDQLRSLLAGDPPGQLRLPGAHLRLLSDFVTYHISASGPLKTFRLLEGLLPSGAHPVEDESAPDPAAGPT